VKNAHPDDVARLFDARGTAAWLDLALEYGPTFRMQGVVATCDPGLAKTVLMERAHTKRRSRFHRLVAWVTPGSAGLLFMEGEPWRRHLRAVMPAFRRDHVDRFAQFLYEAALRRAREWASEAVVPDLFRAVTELGLGQVLNVGFGLDAEHPTVQALGRELIDYKRATMTPDPRLRFDRAAMTNRKLLDLPLLVKVNLDLRRRVRRMRALTQRLPEGCPARLDGQASWLQGLCRERLPNTELTDEVNHLYGAYTAIDYVVTAGLRELSRRADWRERLRTELRTQFGAGGFPRRQDFPRLVDTVHFMREVLRLYPVAMAIYRQTGEAIRVEGEELPAGPRWCCCRMPCTAIPPTGRTRKRSIRIAGTACRTRRRRSATFPSWRGLANASAGTWRSWCSWPL
jgi:cytochrome P450